MATIAERYARLEAKSVRQRVWTPRASKPVTRTYEAILTGFDFVWRDDDLSTTKTDVYGHREYGRLYRGERPFLCVHEYPKCLLRNCESCGRRIRSRHRFVCYPIGRNEWGKELCFRESTDGKLEWINYCFGCWRSVDRLMQRKSDADELGKLVGRLHRERRRRGLTVFNNR